MTTDSSPASATRPAHAPVVDLDVRDDLRQGREPFKRIMAAVGTLQEREVLRVRAIFEPVPLYNALGKRGFRHESVEHAPDDWSAWFWLPAAERGAESDTNARTAVVLDVRGLDAPEPLTRTLDALERLPDGQELLHVNDRVPQLLFPILAERGFACEVDESQAGKVFVRIWRTA